MSRARNWIFTVNNYTDADIAIFNQLVPDTAKYVVYGKEVGESGTPHLQGYVQFKAQLRLASCKKVHPTCYWDAARGTPEENLEYCSKQGDHYEFGTAVKKAQRSDIDAFKEAVSSGENNMITLREEHSMICAKYPGFVRQYLSDHRPLPAVKTHPLYSWQSGLIALLRLEPNDREIIFVVDTTGNSGKSWFCDYYSRVCYDDAQILEMGKKADVALTINPDMRVYFFDLTREHVEHMNYSLLESLKNARLFSPKYESHMVFLSRVPHVVVMMNQEPDMSKLSYDRYKIINV